MAFLFFLLGRDVGKKVIDKEYRIMKTIYRYAAGPGEEIRETVR